MTHRLRGGKARSPGGLPRLPGAYGRVMLLATGEPFSTRGALIGWTLAVGVVSAALLLAAVTALDFTTNGTGNGLWKSPDVEKWMRGAPDRTFDMSAVFYFPVVGGVARVVTGVRPGREVWRLMADANALFGALAVTCVFLTVYQLTRRVAAGVLAALFQLGLGFFLLLATISEDIMPGYAFFLAALALLLAFARTRRGALLFLSAQGFTVSWLLHWTLIAAGPAFVSALVLLPGGRRVRWRRAAAFCLSCLLLVAVASAWSGIKPHRLLFPGKGLGMGWAGFSWQKMVLCWEAMGQYVFGGGNLGSWQVALEPRNLAEAVAGWVVILAVGWLSARVFWRQRAQDAWLAAGAVLAGTLILGEAGNIYSQPQDPQMQIQPMAWLPVGFGAWIGCLALTWWRRAWRGAVLAGVPLAFNLWSFAPGRGADSAAVAELRRVERAVEGRALLLTHGFDQINCWSYAVWGPSRCRVVGIPGRERIKPPLSRGEFAFVMLASEMSWYPRRSAATAGRSLVDQLDAGMRAGYRVVAGPVWDMGEEELVSSLATMAGAEKARAMRRALRRNFEAAALVSTSWGQFYELRHKLRRR